MLGIVGEFVPSGKSAIKGALGKAGITIGKKVGGAVIGSAATVSPPEGAHAPATSRSAHGKHVGHWIIGPGNDPIYVLYP